MSNRKKDWIVGAIAGAFINGVFWFVYSMTDNIVGSIGITAGVSISIFGFLYMLGQIKKS